MRRARRAMSSPRTARRLGVNISVPAGGCGTAAAVRDVLAKVDRVAYERRPEQADPSWEEVEAWAEQ